MLGVGGGRRLFNSRLTPEPLNIKIYLHKVAKEGSWVTIHNTAWIRRREMRALITLPVLFVFTALGFADTINVPADQPSIQAGINAAVNGDTVLVAPGTYVEIIDFLGKAITVKSSHGAETTVIDGDEDYSVVSFYSLEGPDSVLEGFTITNGYSVIGGDLQQKFLPDHYRQHHYWKLGQFWRWDLVR